MTFVQGGTTANYTGTVLEKYAISRLEERGYTYILPDKFMPSRILKQPFYTRKFTIGKSIYGTKQICDFILYHPHKWPNNLVIECKWQQSGGSVDEKFPYLVLNITMKYETPTIILLDGNGYKKGAETWLRKEAGNGNLKHVFNMTEFSTWANKGNI
jgi:hypothetical protein